MRRRDERLARAEGSVDMLADACLELKKQVGNLHKIIRQQQQSLQVSRRVLDDDDDDDGFRVGSC